VTLHGRDLALHDALDRLAAAAHLRLSYSPELLALERRVCVSYDSVSAGAVLSDLLSGSAVSPVIAGDDQVVLAPVTGTRKAEQRAERNVSLLDRVVVTGNPIGAPQRGLAAAVTVIERAQLAHQSNGTLSQALNGVVPGVWVWEQSPSSLLARYGSVRGASSFQLSSPKVYIDGIEVANPLLLTEMSEDAVERVEVIRGPQGAALYGADAIGGVINIIMRHDNGDGAELAQLRSSAGLTQSAFARPALVQEHTLSLRGGSDLRSSSLTMSLGSVGSYVPGADSREARGDGSLRIVGTRSMFTGTARVYAKDAGIGTSPLVASPALADYDGMPPSHEQWRGGTREYSDHPAPRDLGASTQSLREYTLGGTATYVSNETWTHALTLGLDGYRLSGDAMATLTPVPSVADSAIRAAWGGADRATVRVSSVARAGDASGMAATLTVGADYSALQQSGAVADAYSLGSRALGYSGLQGSGGMVAQVDASWRNALFATSGVRVERDDGVAMTNGLATLPIFGGAAVHDFGPVTTKLRASYGTAIRPVGSVMRSSWTAREAVVQGTLAPEEQSGIEAGIDAFVGSAFALHLTRFDQHAYNLIQPVAIASSLVPNPIDGTTRLMYALQNVGEITNRGWELESTVAHGPLSLTGTASLVDSRMRQLTSGYTGDMRPNDRMLGVPARMAGLTSAWRAPRWSAALTVTRASDWVNYDGLALYTASATAGRAIVGEQLRAYWRTYPGVTRVSASLSRQLFGGFSLLFSGQNLLDVQRGEPDNVTVVPGRTVTAGVQARF
jgi:iron complex outermembrane receptor protein